MGFGFLGCCFFFNNCRGQLPVSAKMAVVEYISYNKYGELRKAYDCRVYFECAWREKIAAA